MKSTILDFKEENGLVSCTNINGAKNNSEILYLNEAEKLGASTVLFRRYYKDDLEVPYRSEPTVCIFIREDGFFDSDENIKLHAALWSSAKNEIYIVNSPTRVDIINSRRPAERKSGRKLSLQNLLLASSAAIDGINEQLFSAYLFGNGTFWEQPEFCNQLNEKNSPYIFLLDYLMTVRKILLNNTSINLHPETIDKLLVTCILIKFLEEIKDDKGKHTLRNIYRKFKIQNFAEALENGIVIDILSDLATEFSGQIFDKFTVEEKSSLNGRKMDLLANFLRANININTSQFFLWEQYSFKHLPAEVISAIYENFIQAEAVRQTGGVEKGVVYTPIHLVNLLIDEVMPLSKPELFKNKSYKVLDPSCGSGVFLVAAYKRLLQWWAINNSSPENIQYPGSKEAQKILEENIFGIDVKKTATLISIFGLTTALLDKLTPQEIWNNLKFRDLSEKNIEHSDFFEWAIKAKEKQSKFDLVIGNPPFNVESGMKKENILKPEVLSKLSFKFKNIPSNNFALHFFEASIQLTSKVCLIIPANVVLYNKSAHEYRVHLFSDYTVEKIFDFTHLRRDLFHKAADTPVVALIVQNIPSKKSNIEHVVVKRTISTERKIRFEIDYYDRHSINWSWAIDKEKLFVWKANLLGGGRLFHVINKLKQLPTLKDYLNFKIDKNPEWIYSSGYKIGGKSTEKTKADFLHNKLTVETGTKFDFSSGGFSTVIETSNEFEAPRKKALYEPPLLIIAEVLGEKGIPMQLFDRYQPFNISFIGIHSPKEDLAELKLIYERLYNNKEIFQVYRMFMFVTSSKLLINKETAFVKEDLDGLPFPENDALLKLTPTESIIQDDVLNYQIHLGKAIGKNGAGNVFIKKADPIQLEKFGKIFCSELNSLYSKNGKSWQQGTVIYDNMFTIYPFGFGNDDGFVGQFEAGSTEIIKKLIDNKISNSGAIFKKIIRVYKHLDGFDCLFLIKPNTQRYWLNSIALKDADDTFFDLKQAGF